MIGVASHRAALRFSQMRAMRVIPVRLSGFGSVAMYWREDPFRPVAVQEAMTALRNTVAEHAPGAARA
ncbi:hypothetical protein D9M68_787000 [compost metagenome]